MKPLTDGGISNGTADLAIARVLDAERRAREAIAQARLEVQQIAENARADARSVAERTERRIRAVVDAFERELADRLAEIDAAGTQLDAPQAPTADEREAVRRVVEALAHELVGVRP